MITTVTLNAAIDKTYYLPQFPHGEVSRVKEVRSMPGGKGINVARVVQHLGGEALASGFVGGSNGRFIEKILTQQGVTHDFVHVDGESRICLNIIQTMDNSSTELLEPGPMVQSSNVDDMVEKLKSLAAQSKLVVFSGSLPQGTPVSLYRTLIEAVQVKDCKVYLDTSGPALIEGIEAKPNFIKPNEQELCQILKLDQLQIEEVPDYVLAVMDKGIQSVAVTLGAEGAVFGFEGKVFRVKAPIVKSVNPVGCGDAFVAGMAFASVQKMPLEQCIRWASATGTANALTADAGMVDIKDVERLLELVEIHS